MGVKVSVVHFSPNLWLNKIAPKNKEKAHHYYIRNQAKHFNSTSDCFETILSSLFHVKCHLI